MQIKTVRRLLALPEDDVDVGKAALLLSSIVDANTDVDAGMKMLNDIAARVRVVAAARGDNGDTRVRAMNTVLFREFGFHYDQTDPMGHNYNNKTFWGLLTRRKGNCVMLPTLWLAVAQRLGYPAKAVLAPQHVFVRYDDGTYKTNIEATSGGGSFEDDTMVRELRIPAEAISSGNMMRSLSKREFIQNLIGELGVVYAAFGNDGFALQILEMVLEKNPRAMPEHANLALVYAKLAAATTAIRSSPEHSQASSEQIAEFAKNAISHARRATELGAVPFLEEGYWKKEGNGRKPERAAAYVSARPYEIEWDLRPGGLPIALMTRDGLLPTTSQALSIGYNSAGALVKECASLCGPGPGNYCVELSKVYP